jgi:hypothetical protein
MSSSPGTSPSLIGHDNGTPSPKAEPAEKDQDSHTPATNNKQKKAVYNESNQARLMTISEIIFHKTDAHIIKGSIASISFIYFTMFYFSYSLVQMGLTQLSVSHHF